jgi:hypothetical protein
MVSSHGIEFGTCPCGSRYEVRWVEVRMTVDDEGILLSNVPQGACPLCTSRVYKPAVLERIEAVMKGEPVDTGLKRVF